MIEIDRFDALEKKIEKLLGSYNSLCREKDLLNERIKVQEKEIKSLKEEMLHLTQVREAVQKKIEGLINRLDILIPSRQGEQLE